MKLLIVLIVLLSIIKLSYSFDICVPNQWEGSSETEGSDGVVIRKNYYYDETNLRVRIDTIYSDGSFNQTTFSNYASLTVTGTEWVLDNVANNCFQTGPDYWNSQCFGDSYALPYAGTEDGDYYFKNPTNGIEVLTQTNGLPVFMINNLSLTKTKFYNTQSSISDDTVFNLPSNCH